MPRSHYRDGSPRGSTPDMSLVKSEYLASPHLLDHGYGATPQSQIMGTSHPISTAPVKRKLNLEGRNVIVPMKQEFKPPQPKRPKRASPTKKNTRYDTSLGLLTQKFSAILETSPNGVVDLNNASKQLNVQKRRIYDITNVLEGIGLIEKKSKNNIQLKGGTKDGRKMASLRKQMQALEDQENKLDRLIGCAENELHNEVDNKYGYVTYQDLRSIEKFKYNTLIVVRAPPDTHLKAVTASDGDEKHSVYMKSQSGEVQVYLCPDCVPPATKAKPAPMDTLIKDLQYKLSPKFDMSTPPVPLLDSPTMTRKPISSQVCRSLSFSTKDEPSTSSASPSPPPSSSSASAAPMPVQNSLLFNSNDVMSPSPSDMDSFRLSPIFGFHTCMETNKLGAPFMSDHEVLGPLVGPYSLQAGNSEAGFCDPLELFQQLEPLPPSQYNFGMDTSEGLADLYDLL